MLLRTIETYVGLPELIETIWGLIANPHCPARGPDDFRDSFRVVRELNKQAFKNENSNIGKEDFLI